MIHKLIKSLVENTFLNNTASFLCKGGRLVSTCHVDKQDFLVFFEYSQSGFYQMGFKMSIFEPNSNLGFIKRCPP